MKLLNKITIWFIGVIFLVTPITMVISRTNIKKHLDKAEEQRMRAVNDHVYQQLLTGVKLDHYTHGRPIDVSLFQGPMPAERVQTVKEIAPNEDLAKNECRITVTSYYQIGKQIYKVSSYNYVLKSEEIFAGMLSTVVWKMLLIILCVGLTARLLSRIILEPFYRGLKIIKHFDVKKSDQKLQLAHTTTTEFKELNDFIESMAQKARADYAAIKEFSENASHELQTPLAVVRSKLDLLSQTPINDKQAQLIGDMQASIERLSHINRSLVLLTKLENHEYATSENIKFCAITKRVIATYEDWVKMKDIDVSSNLDANIVLNIHPALAEILLSNLFSNAIRYNLEGGKIKVELNKYNFIISNTGNPPELPTAELFRRFKKGNQSGESTGLGLAIVKQICTVNDFSVTYNFENGWHQVKVMFAQPEVKPTVEKICAVAEPKVAVS
ncbi:HAMP domain-containing sensor histidine kinase [Chitinophaga sp. sic0106]|uniref:sensor histidine kinase n=1 Tax=Chitinophaga sp. sic0106 TaxID=2854785 RepID=UPI001C440F6F|nr:HAMP domain-containing sensor histidine kinase [Chitinophaga sp. sic0106]MBV7529248.1 HAMP domain-containing histidine kinase [Chitinophaga sp. sic0106]